MDAKIPKGAGIGIKPISRANTIRLVRKAIQYAIDRNRKSVTLVHKGNIMKYTEGAFRAWGYELARQEFGDITITERELWNKFEGEQPKGKILIKDRIADIMFQHLLLRPTEFDVLAAPNLNGDYLSDAVAAQVGGVGIAPGGNIGDYVALFEATHGSAPKYTDKDMANPGSLLFSAVMMLEYMGWFDVAAGIDEAYEKTIAQKIVTYDFARQMEGATKVGTADFATAIIANL
jgi:isocitrate dehydrogenase